jgi:hypothetical protein
MPINSSVRRVCELVNIDVHVLQDLVDVSAVLYAPIRSWFSVLL